MFEPVALKPVSEKTFETCEMYQQMAAVCKCVLYLDVVKLSLCHCVTMQPSKH